MIDKLEELSKEEKVLILKQIERTIENHSITTSTICDWIFISGLVSDYGLKPLDLLKMLEIKSYRGFNER